MKATTIIHPRGAKNANLTLSTVVLQPGTNSKRPSGLNTGNTTGTNQSVEKIKKLKLNLSGVGSFSATGGLGLGFGAGANYAKYRKLNVHKKSVTSNQSINSRFNI